MKRLRATFLTGVFFALFIAGCIAIKPTERLEFSAPDAYPEGIVFDSTANVYYVSSARNGAVGKVTVAGEYSVLHGDSSLKSTYGMKLRPGRNELVVCVGDANYSKITSPDTRYKMARLISIDAASGKKLSDIDLSGLVAGKHFPNDLTFDDEGNCYITDSYAHAIYKVAKDGKASVFAKSDLFVTEGIGLNGIVYHPGRFLIVDNSNTGGLYKIDINDPTKVSKIKINQFFLGADGLLLKDSSSLVMVVNGNNDKIFQLTSEDNWITAEMKSTTLIADRFTYPSTAAKRGDDIWVMNAKFNELVDSNSVPSKTFAIQKAVFNPIPKKLRK
jgi:sugar lactone lactonase YvrE